jgi:hypothetical protein
MARVSIRKPCTKAGYKRSRSTRRCRKSPPRRRRVSPRKPCTNPLYIRSRSTRRCRRTAQMKRIDADIRKLRKIQGPERQAILARKYPAIFG